MSNQRRHKTSDPFNLSIDGCLGQFALDEPGSTPVYFFTSTLTLEQLERLDTAKDAIPDNVDLEFDAMIQREINPEHVGDIEKYFQPGQRLRFFPPLLAAIIETNSSGIEKYYPDCIVQQPGKLNDDYLEMTWGDLFQCRVGADIDGSSRAINLMSPAMDKSTFRVCPYLGQLRINTDKAKLVVVDGQHRLKALRNLRASAVSQKDQQRFVPLNVSVCFFWTPSSKALPQAPDVVSALRSVFVDVNSKAQKVSGHFEILLNDALLGSVAVRSFCEHVRKTLLPFIEWDQHEFSLSYQLSLPDKVTSVGLLHEALTNSGVSSLGRRPDYYIMTRVFPYALGLEAVRSELEAAGPENNYAQLTKWDARFYPQQREILKKAIDKTLAPSLEHIYMTLKPYRLIRETCSEAVDKWLLSQDGNLARLAARSLPSVIKPTDTAIAELRTKLLRVLAESVEERDSQPVALAKTQRFQQGLFGAYYLFLNLIVTQQLDIAVLEATKVFVEYLNRYPFKDNSPLFKPIEPWTWGTVYRGANGVIIKSTKTRIPIAHLMLSSLGNKICCQEIVAMLSPSSDAATQSRLSEALEKLGTQTASLFLARYAASLAEEIVSNLEYEDIPESTRAICLRLRDIRDGMRKEANTSKRQADKELREAVDVLVQQKMQPIAARLQALLGFKIEESAPTSDMDDDEQ